MPKKTLLALGKVYRFKHHHKGIFFARVTDMDEDTVTVLILKGTAYSPIESAERTVGDALTMNKLMFSYQLLPEDWQP